MMTRAVSGGAARSLLDPARLAPAGTHAAITYFQPSWDGKYVAVGVSLGGSEDATLRVVQTASGELLKDAITRTQYASPSWTDDSRGMYFMRLQELPTGAPPTSVYENTRVYLHTVGATDPNDKAVFGADLNPELKLPKGGSCLPLP
jgi:prolyl oligopeptidase